MSAQARVPVAPEVAPARAGAWFWLAAALLTAVVGQGAVSMLDQLHQGEIVTAMRTLGAGGAPWGMYIAFVVYFFGVAFAGLSLAALTYIVDLPELRPFSRLGMLMTLAAIILGGSCILADLGAPLNGLLNLPRYARISSPFFGTFTLVMGGFLFPSLVMLYLTGRADAAALARQTSSPVLRLLYRAWASGYSGTAGEVARHRRAAFWLSLAILPSLVTEKSTLGLVFGIQGGRPGWYGALQAPSFLVLGAVSGLGLLTVLAALARRGLPEGALPARGFRILANTSWVLILVYLYFMVVEELTASYAGGVAEAHVAHEVVMGVYSPVFWTVVACLVLALALLFVQFVRGTTSVAVGVAAGLLVNVAAVLKRYLIVVPSQTHGALLPYEVGRYVPSAHEVSVLVGLFALGALVILVFSRLFPLVPGDTPGRDVPAAPETSGRRALRLGAFLGTLALGVTLAVVGFLASARVGTAPEADPVIPFAPVLFILGVMALFYSAVVFELFPGPSQEARAGAP